MSNKNLDQRIRRFDFDEDVLEEISHKRKTPMKPNRGDVRGSDDKRGRKVDRKDKSRSKADYE
jgi:hypothetical protein